MLISKLKPSLMVIAFKYSETPLIFLILHIQI